MKRTSSHFGLVLLMSLLLVIMYSSFTSGQKVPALPCRTDGDCLVLGAGNWVCTNKVCSDSSNGGSTSPSSIANSPTGTGPTQTASSTPNSSSNSSTSSFPLWAVIFIVVVAAGLLLALGVFLYWNKIRRASEPGIPGRSRRGGGGGGDGSNKTVSHLNNNSNSLTMVNMVDKSLSSSSAAPFVAVPPSVEPQQQQMAAFHEQQMSDMMMQQQQHHHHLPAMYVHQALPPAPLSIVAAATSNAPTARPKKDYSEAAQFLRMSRVDA